MPKVNQIVVFDYPAEIPNYQEMWPRQRGPRRGRLHERQCYKEEVFNFVQDQRVCI